MGGEVKHLVGHESPNEDQVPTTFELKEYGYLALARGLGSGLYEAAGGLSNQASGGLEILVVQNGELESGIEDDVGGLRQSSMDLEPYTLDISAIKEAKVLLPSTICLATIYCSASELYSQTSMLGFLHFLVT